MAEAAALFFAAFLAATIFPFSSEAALVAALASGMNPSLALTAASVGNILAILLNYGLGFLLYEATHKKLEMSKSGRKALAWGHQYGYWTLALSWLPIIGDPITLVAGVMRLNLLWFVLIAGSLRVLRYGVIIALF